MTTLRQFLSPIPPKGMTPAEKVERDRAPVGDLPVVETYTNGNLPSGGTQNHGVDPIDSRVNDPRGFDVHGYDGIVLDPPTQRPDPVLVTVVRDETDAPEFKQWRSVNTTTTSAQANRIVSQDRSRTTVTIRTGADGVWIGPNESVSAQNGFPVPPNTDRSLTSTEDVWAVSMNPDPLAVSPVFLLMEYTVNT